MEERQKNLLKIIIKEYIKTAEPISSRLLVEKFKLPYSPATVRHELVKLEEEGYIYQPHTSAGRIPTEKAYHFYIKNCLSNKEPKAGLTVRKNNEKFIKQTARELANRSGLAVFWETDGQYPHYTGISNLLSQPEFIEAQEVINISKVIDDIEDIIADMHPAISNEPQIFIGEENPFGETCGSIVVKYKHGRHSGIFGIVGPMRMDYQKCLELIIYIKNQIG